MSTKTKHEELTDIAINRESENCSVNLFDTICRICFTRNEVSNIFKQYYKRTSLNEIISTCLAIQVEKNDELPQNICKWCTSKVTKLYTFRLNCQQSDTMLRVACNTQNLDCNENSSTIAKTVPTSAAAATNGIMFTYVCVKKEEEDIKSILPQSEEKLTALEVNPNNTAMALDFGENIIDIKKEDIVIKSMPSQNEDEVTCSEINSNTSDMALDFKESSIKIKEDDIGTKIKPFPQCEGKIIHKISKSNLNTNSTTDVITNGEMTTLEKKYSYKKCNITYDSYAKFFEHRRKINHGNYICKVCNKTFSFKRNLTAHIKIHANERPYHCQVCTGKFNRKDNLRRHILTHTGERPFKCTECGRDFVRAELLTAHKMMHVGDKLSRPATSKIVCTICNRHLSSHAILQKHLLTHGEKTFLCNYCGKSFPTDVSLNSHVIDVHSGTKRYVCKVLLVQSNKDLTSE